MDAQRFDNLAKTLASRLSRRNAFRRAGAGVAASLLAATGIRPAQAAALIQAQNDEQPLFTLIRRYTLNVPTGQVRRALQQGYVEDACNAPGFVAYLTVEDEDGDFVTVAVFRSQNDLANFATAEASWIAQNLDTLLPAPDEAISGDSYIHAVAPQGFPNTCAATLAPPPPPAPTFAPAQPTSAPAQPTVAPSGPTPTPVPACTGQGCVCTTGTQAPCDGDLVCCPTTDLIGGPGVCQPGNVCYPNQCRANGDSCARSCGTTDACPGCCSNYCNGDGVCDDPPPPCTGAGCRCAPEIRASCGTGLVCCQTGSYEGSTCAAPSDCAAATCPNYYCGCQTGVQGACADFFVCCGTTSLPGGRGICLTNTECNPTCTGQDCLCSGGVQGACDPGFVCCQNGTVIPGGTGTCQPEGQCAPPSCTGEGCDCIGGTQDACDGGLICCVQGDPGAPGTCQTEASCPGSLCTSQGCDCNGGVQGACQDGLICCQEDSSIPGGPGTCQPPDVCGPPPCRDNGAACGGTCNWDDSCGACCSGYCNSSGACDAPPQSTCISDGENCGGTCNWSDGCAACCSGFCDGAGNCNEPGASAGACGDEGCSCELANPACVDGLVCCDDGSGVTGTCTTGC